MSDPGYPVTVAESGNGPYGQMVTAGRHVSGADEPEAVGGHDTGPAPFELLLTALGACTSMTVRMYANRRELPLRHVSVRLRHLRTEAGTDRFERLITLEGELSADQRQRLMEIAAKCPVSRTLSRGSEVVDTLA